MSDPSPDALRKIAEESLALAEKATPGPWSDMRLGSDRNEQPNEARIRVIADADDPDRPGFYWHIASVSYERRTARPRKWRITIEQAELNADFIAHARTSLPALASAYLAATRSIAELRAAVVEMFEAQSEEVRARVPADSGHGSASPYHLQKRVNDARSKLRDLVTTAARQALAEEEEEDGRAV